MEKSNIIPRNRQPNDPLLNQFEDIQKLHNSKKLREKSYRLKTEKGCTRR